MNDEIESLLKGSIDLNVHAAPDIPKRRMDALETTRAAYEAGMGGFVLKSHNPHIPFDLRLISNVSRA